MFSLLRIYWEFIFREPSKVFIPTGGSSVNALYEKTVVWSVFFTLLNYLVPFLAKTCLSSWYKSLTPRKRDEMPAYAICLVHHFLLVPVAVLHIWQDFQRSDVNHDYSLTESWVSPISLGYLIGDTIGYALPELLRGRSEYLIHHVLTLWLVWSSIWGPGQLLRYIPHLLICDSTNICFNLAWLLRTTSWRESGVVTVLEVSFCILFLVFRVVNLPLVFLTVTMHGLDQGIGYARFTFLPIAILQWYWFSKIASGLYERLCPSKKIVKKHMKE
eukprot:gene9596-10607_t